ncbi:Gfa-like protein [Minicystis rosea]|nr:Gfa-like protein [Minicystis rosea]
MSSLTFHASCLCGQVRWEVDGPLRQPDPADSPLAVLAMSHCHCGRCRKAHGAPYATYLAVSARRFRITHGHDHIARFASSPAMARAFCDVCGSVVPDGSVSAEGFAAMPAGPFDEDPGLTPMCHIFVASKAPWVTLPEDGLPRFATYPEALGVTPMETRAPVDPEGSGARASCLCGAVAFVVTGTPIRCRTCHCSRCRKAGSAAHVSYLVTAFDGMHFTRGEALVSTYKVPEARYFKHAFCRECGSTVLRKDAERGIAIAAMGALDDDPGVRPASHIYVGSGVPWDVITDGLPQFEEAPPG